MKGKYEIVLEQMRVGILILMQLALALLNGLTIDFCFDEIIMTDDLPILYYIILSGCIISCHKLYIGLMLSIERIEFIKKWADLKHEQAELAKHFQNRFK